jgi:hypothetical protein
MAIDACSAYFSPERLVIAADDVGVIEASTKVVDHKGELGPHVASETVEAVFWFGWLVEYGKKQTPLAGCGTHQSIPCVL